MSQSPRATAKSFEQVCRAQQADLLPEDLMAEHRCLTPHEALGAEWCS